MSLRPSLSSWYHFVAHEAGGVKVVVRAAKMRELLAFAVMVLTPAGVTGTSISEELMLTIQQARTWSSK